VLNARYYSAGYASSFIDCNCADFMGPPKWAADHSKVVCGVDRPDSMFDFSLNHSYYCGAEHATYHQKNRQCTVHNLRLLRRFNNLYGDLPRFTTTYIHDFHDNMAGSFAASLDDTFLSELQQMHSSGDMERSMYVFFSDHGLHFGPHLETLEGQVEHKLPLLISTLPRAWLQARPVIAANLAHNAANSLVTAYDLHATAEHLVELNARGPRSPPPEQRRHKSLSLFTKVESSRTCDDAGISPTLCVCDNAGWKVISSVDALKDETDREDLLQVASIAVNHMNNRTLDGRPHCVQLELAEVESARVKEWRKSTAMGKIIKVQFVVSPGSARYSAEVYLRGHGAFTWEAALNGQVDVTDVHRLSMMSAEDEQSYKVDLPAEVRRRIPWGMCLGQGQADTPGRHSQYFRDHPNIHTVVRWTRRPLSNDRHVATIVETKATSINHFEGTDGGLSSQKARQYLLPDEDPLLAKLRFRHDTCAVVGNGATVRGAGLGSEIDSADLVLRMNWPPVRRCGSDDCGTKTSWMFVSQRGDLTSGVPGGSGFTAEGETYAGQQDLVVLYEGRGKGSLERMVASARTTGSPSAQHVISLFLTNLADELVCSVLGKQTLSLPPGERRCRASTGMRATLAALLVCNTVRVYGFGLTNETGYGPWYTEDGLGIRRESPVLFYDAESQVLDALEAGIDLTLLQHLQLGALERRDKHRTLDRAAFGCMELPFLGCVPNFLMFPRRHGVDEPWDEPRYEDADGARSPLNSSLATTTLVADEALLSLARPTLPPTVTASLPTFPAGRYPVDRNLSTPYGPGEVLTVVQGDAFFLRLLPDQPTAHTVAATLAQLHHAGVRGVPRVVEGPFADVPMLVHRGHHAVSLLAASVKFDEDGIKEATQAVLRVLASAHEAGVVHGNLSPTNILLQNEGGLPLLVGWGSAVPTDLTWSYLAPEQLLGQSGPTPATDVWAVGAVLASLVYDREPFFAGRNRREVLLAVARARGSAPFDSLPFDSQWREENWTPQLRKPWSSYQQSHRMHLVSSELDKLLDAMLNTDGAARATATDALDMPWFDSVRLIQTRWNETTP